MPQRAASAITVALLAAARARAQGVAPQPTSTTPPSSPYPSAPTAVLDVKRLTRDVKLSGYVSVRQTRRNDSTSFAVNRARITATMAPLPTVAAKLQVDFAGRLTSGDTLASQPTLTDAFVQLTAPERWRLAGALRPALLAGQFKVPFGAEFLTSFSLLQTANRSMAVDRLSPRRDVGVMGQVELARALRLSGALLNGSGSNTARNDDGRELAMGRVSLLPLPGVSLSAKWSGQATDHRWGYDGRWVGHGAIVEGEWIARHRTTNARTVTDARGGYALASYKVLSWLQPVVKWEDFRDRLAATRERWTTLGVNVLSPTESLRLLTDYTIKRERPTRLKNDELVVQLLIIF